MKTTVAYGDRRSAEKTKTGIPLDLQKKGWFMDNDRWYVKYIETATELLAAQSFCDLKIRRAFVSDKTAHGSARKRVRLYVGDLDDCRVWEHTQRSNK